MQTKVFQTDKFRHDGRGDIWVRWLDETDFAFPDPAPEESDRRSYCSVLGAQYATEYVVCEWAYVIFYGLQVIQIVPEEVHAYWHREYASEAAQEPGVKTGVWEIEDSEWMKTFSPRHLADHKHFIIEFYDDIVEVICRDLIFGEGEFNLEELLKTDKRFNIAYMQQAETYKTLGRMDEAMTYYQKYIDNGPDEGIPNYLSSVKYAQMCIDNIRNGEPKG